MTSMRSQYKADHEALQAVRWAIKGWAFVHKDSLPGYIAHAEREKQKLPARLQVLADKLIEPLRQALAEENP